MPRPAAGGRIEVLLDVDGVVNALPDDSDEEWLKSGDGLWAPDSYERIVINGFTINYSTELVSALVELSSTPGVEITWCTTWQGKVREIEDALGLPQWPWVVDPADDESTNALAAWFKADYVRGRLADTVNPVGKLVWIDDDIGAWRNLLKATAGNAPFLEDPRLFTVAPVSARGLAPSEFDTVRALVRGA